MDRLLDIASPALSGDEPRAEDMSGLGPIGSDLLQMLSERNGFYAFESALHVFASAERMRSGYSIGSWNDRNRWLDAYGALQPNLVFFAEDVFGGQFGTDGTRIYSFNPETAKLTELASSLPDWTERVLDDYAYLTGYPVAHEWQSRHGAIPVGHRLTPRIPFVFGGNYDADNMVLTESAAAMRYWGGIANAIARVSDGTQLRFDPSVVEHIRCAAAGPDGPRVCRCYPSAGEPDGSHP
ncbi:hypothetical protein AB0N14_05400 [Streptomyces sp. NPDC051104]|uniref:hypothetical protein n=1 Tax=Streptomyces sp. NPDC051104 TaxID=3155044 RepID=UPI00343D790D